MDTRLVTPNRLKRGEAGRGVLRSGNGRGARGETSAFLLLSSSHSTFHALLFTALGMDDTVWTSAEDIGRLKKESLPNDERSFDQGLVPLLRLINGHPDFVTTLSCVGHYEVCRGRARAIAEQRRLSGYSAWLPDPYTGEGPLTWDDVQPLFCHRSTQPFLQFRTTSRQAPFLERLGKAAASRGFGLLAPKRHRPTAWVYYYGDGDEGYSPELKMSLSRSASAVKRLYWRDELTGTPAFAEFWALWLDCWRASGLPCGDPPPPALLPTRFPPEAHACQCDHKVVGSGTLETRPRPARSWEHLIIAGAECVDAAAVSGLEEREELTRE